MSEGSGEHFRFIMPKPDAIGEEIELPVVADTAEAAGEVARILLKAKRPEVTWLRIEVRVNG